MEIICIGAQKEAASILFQNLVCFEVIELDKEKSRTEMAFHDFVPPAVVKRIKSKKGKEVGKDQSGDGGQDHQQHHIHNHYHRHRSGLVPKLQVRHNLLWKHCWL